MVLYDNLVGPEGIAITTDAVWVANSLDLTVDRLDPATGRVTFTIPVGDGPSAIAAASDGVWVSDEFGATLDRIDPHTNRVSRVISLGSTPRGIAATGSGVWVAAPSLCQHWATIAVTDDDWHKPLVLRRDLRLERFRSIGDIADAFFAQWYAELRARIETICTSLGAAT